MSAEDTGNVQQAAQDSGLSAVGKRLSKTRREQERELAAVASDLHLNLEVVAALESGDQSKLPAATFVRGYIKSYARLLGINDEPLLAMLPDTEDYRPAPLRSVGMHRRQLNLPLGKWLMWLVALAVLVTLVVYGIPVVERLLTKTEQTVAQDSLPLPLDATPAEEEEAADLVPVMPEVTETPAIEAIEAVEPPAESSAVVEKAKEPAPPVAEVEKVQAAGPAEITLRFSQDSWVEMESHGRKLVVGTQPAGSERTVRAEPPVQLLLGNAPGVVVEYRGRVIDLKPHQRGKVARLVLED